MNENSDKKRVGFDPFWERYLAGEIRPQISMIMRVVKEKIVPLLEQAEKEASKVEEELWYQPCYSDSFDAGDLAEIARDAGLERFELVTNITYGILNMFAVSLYHLFEQHLFYMHQREFADFNSEKKSCNMPEVKTALSDLGISIEAFGTYPKIEELRFLCNCIKHGEGWSCEKLRQIRPGFFTYPIARDREPSTFTPPVSVTNPISGDDLWVTEKDLEGYAQAVIDFFQELFRTNHQVREDAGLASPF